MLVRCAYGSPLDTSAKIPSHSARVEVAVRESAFNPLSSPSAAAQPDERIYVAFQQHIMFQVGTLGASEPCNDMHRGSQSLACCHATHGFCGLSAMALERLSGTDALICLSQEIWAV